MCSYWKLGIQTPTTNQIDTSFNFMVGKDVLVCLPTGEGKSYCFASIPIVFDTLHEGQVRSIGIVVSPLKALIKNQVERFNKVAQPKYS